MASPRLGQRIAWGALCLGFAVGCNTIGNVDAPPPATIVDKGVDSLPVLPPSLVDAPITYDLTPAIATLEASVPTKFGDIEARKRSATNRRVSTASEEARNSTSVIKMSMGLP